MAFGMLLIRFFILLIFSLLLAGCCDSVQPIPVAEVWRQPLDSPMTYTVKGEDTLYSIAWFYDLDYRQIAADNGIDPPYAIHAGQKLRLGGKSSFKPKAAKPVTPKVAKVPASATFTKTITKQPIKPVEKPVEPAAIPAKTRILPMKTMTSAGITWSWPTRGCIICYYANNGLNKGIDITARLGNPVTAAADGKVVYAGNGLRGYGELIIIKHSDEYLSAYAHNQKILVQEGQSIRRGQMVALMGTTDAKCVMLHFEIRKAGKPVDPICYLPKN